MELTRQGSYKIDFVPLTISCVDVSPIGFGMKVEVDMTTGHDTSTLLLHFSNDGGSVYYNKDEPRETVFLYHDIPPGRKLYDCNLNCDPMSNFGKKGRGCRTCDCASTNLEDGCKACMCYNNGNASWCDGTKSAYYDYYFQEHKQNPFGDSKKENRKCNRNFSPKDASCQRTWECVEGLI